MYTYIINAQVLSIMFFQDRSLSAARLVCRNSGLFLQRKDSSGTILKWVSTEKRALQKKKTTSQPILESLGSRSRWRQ